MKLAEVSIARPVFASMLIAAIVLFGSVLYARLNVAMFPKVDFPIVTVTTVYAGADPATMESQIAEPIEEALNSLGGIRALRSVSLESVAQVFVEFDLKMDLGAATQDVRDRLATLTLPGGAEAPLVQKLDLGAAPILQLSVASAADPRSVASYVQQRLKPELERVPGVGQVDIIGAPEREVHAWIDATALRANHLTFSDVVHGLAAQNVEVPGGRLDDGQRELVVRTHAAARDPAALADVVLSHRGGADLRLRDVARVEDGHEERRSSASLDGQAAVAVIIRKQSDANTVVVADEVLEALERLRAAAPLGTEIQVLFDNSREIRASIETVQLDLALGALLAVFIIFLFLRDARATFISALALPTSVIGTFGFINIMGFTLNMMTTLALSLSIGILIDDAIVVIENISRRRTTLGESPMDAASRGTAEIGLAVMATTLSIVAVFVPVAFMEGMIGQFFFEFGLTVAFAVLLSLFVSFSLTPMLSARFLKAHHGEHRGLSAAIEAVLVGLERGYRRLIGAALRHRVVTMGLAVVALVGTFAVAPLVGFEFVPMADKGQFSVKLELQSGTSLAETERRVSGVAERLRAVTGVASTFSTIGGGAQERVNTAQVMVTLVPKAQRAFHQRDAMAHIRALLAGEPGVIVSVEQLDTVGAGGGARQAAVHLNLRGGDLASMAAAAQRIADRLKAAGGFVDIDTTVRLGRPEVEVALDRPRAADLSVSAIDLAMTVRGLVAGQVATQFDSHGERYDVRVQLPADQRASIATIETAQVRTSGGRLVEIGDIAAITAGSGPAQIEREARQRQVSVLANLDGKVLGDALAEVRVIAAEEVGSDIAFEFGGNSKMLEESVASMLLALFLAVACVYMILAAQFESFIHPFTIMASLPFALSGAFGGLLVAGMSMSIFAMIGLIMLMGLVTKNAILLIDFAIHRRAAGEAVNDALISAGVIRLRPILMTTAAMIFGMLPVAIGHGDGGEIRAPMGVVVIGGLISSTALTLVVVPVLYALVDAMSSGWSRLWRRLAGHRDVAVTPTSAAGPQLGS